jgi:hypothetical protein
MTNHTLDSDPGNLNLRPVVRESVEACCEEDRRLSWLYYFRFSWRSSTRASVIPPARRQEGARVLHAKARELVFATWGYRFSIEMDGAAGGQSPTELWRPKNQNVPSMQAVGCVMSRSNEHLSRSCDRNSCPSPQESAESQSRLLRTSAGRLIETNSGSRRTRYLALRGRDCRESFESTPGPDRKGLEKSQAISS